MLQAFFNGLSGLLSFSKGLNNVSNNVSNMNTPGYRGSDTFFRSVVGQDGEGYGADVAGTAVRTKPGETRQTGNSTDLAINGIGYFIVRDSDGDIFYTRSAQFQVDKDGFLVDSVTQDRVAGLDASGNLIDINISQDRTLPPKPTTKIEMVGSLARSGPPTAGDIISSVQVFDATGATKTLQISLDPKAGTNDTWVVTVTDETGATLKTGEIQFGLDGSPANGFNTLDVPVTSNGQTQNITLDFGKPGNFNLAYQVASAANHTLNARVVDGSAVAGMTSFSFDSKGVLKFVYSNGEKRDGAQLGLADFADESALIARKASLYQAPATTKAQYGRPGSSQFGLIQGGYIELSNVDLSQEFGDILIIQRGYQASSRIVTVSNEMVEQLYGATRGG